MNRLEHLLTIVGEECAEIAQRASKANRFGMHEVQPGQSLTNAQRITGEVNDLVAALQMAFAEADLEFAIDRVTVAAKWAKVEKYLDYSAELGTLEDGPGCIHGYEHHDWRADGPQFVCKRCNATTTTHAAGAREADSNTQNSGTHYVDRAPLTAEPLALEVAKPSSSNGTDGKDSAGKAA